MLDVCRKVLIVGGAGFIGSHLVHRLMADTGCRVTVFDNFSSGREWHLEQLRIDPRLTIVEADASDLSALMAAVDGSSLVIHLASNPDIAKAVTHPEIDFYQGTLLTHQVLEAMRRCGVKRLLYASGSGVYGDRGAKELQEEDVVGYPVSTYGASKLAGEALIASYCAMFGFSAAAFRFGNVVGPRQTHGVGYDFLRRLRRQPERLEVLGNGAQSKPYLHVSDAIGAMLVVGSQMEGRGFEVFNVATSDCLRVDEIAHMAVQCFGDSGSTAIEYTGGDRGWKGDVPVVRLKTGRIRALGWEPVLCSREAMGRSLKEMMADERIFWN